MAKRTMREGFVIDEPLFSVEHLPPIDGSGAPRPLEHRFRAYSHSGGHSRSGGNPTEALQGLLDNVEKHGKAEDARKLGAAIQRYQASERKTGTTEMADLAVERIAALKRDALNQALSTDERHAAQVELSKIRFGQTALSTSAVTHCSCGSVATQRNLCSGCTHDASARVAGEDVGYGR